MTDTLSGTMRVLRSGVTATLALLLAACAHGPAEDNDALLVRIKTGAGTIVAQLDDTPTARTFVALLPLRLSLRDHASIEKVAALPEKLSLEGAPAGTDADVYDIAYYAPLGNFVMYYRDPGYFAGLVRLGHIQAGTEKLHIASGTVTIETITP